MVFKKPRRTYATSKQGICFKSQGTLTGGRGRQSFFSESWAVTSHPRSSSTVYSSGNSQKWNLANVPMSRTLTRQCRVLCRDNSGTPTLHFLASSGNGPTWTSGLLLSTRVSINESHTGSTFLLAIDDTVHLRNVCANYNTSPSYRSCALWLSKGNPVGKAGQAEPFPRSTWRKQPGEAAELTPLGEWALESKSGSKTEHIVC